MKKKLLIILIFLFSFIIFLILTDTLLELDTNINNFVQNIETDNLTKIFLFITFLASPICMIIIAFLSIILFLIKKSKKIIHLIVMMVSSSLINSLIKIIVRRDRPAFHIIEETNYSFPSGHTVGAVALYGFIVYFIINSNIKKFLKIILSVVLCLIILLIASSRIYLGVHYFSDVCGGLLLGTILILVYDFIIKKKIQ